jgi:CheY-like chemotaxis protein
MVLVEEHTGTLAEAFPTVRRRKPLLAMADEPSALGSTGARPRRNAEQPQDAAPGPDLTGVKILVVDDDTASLEYFAFALETCGAVVTVAESARDALQMIAPVSPDVVLSDIAMPGGDGYWLLGEIRRHADATVNQLPIVAATAYGRDHSRERVLAAGFHEHLSKPVDPDLLCRVIAAAVGR